MKVMYVSPSGDDTTGTGTSTNPYRTIEYALSLFDSGDQIRLLEGTFTPVDSIVIVDKEGSIFSDYPGAAIIQPVAALSSAACISIIGSDRFTIQGVEIRQDSAGLARIGIMAYGVNHFICKTCSVDGFNVPSGDTYGIFGHGRGRIENCKIYDVTSAGENLYGVWTNNMHLIDCEVYSLSGSNSVSPLALSSTLSQFNVTNIVFVL